MSPSVALVYDRVNTPYGGAEKVLRALHQIFPDAPLYTSVYHPQAKWAREFEIKTSFIQHLPFAQKHHRIYAPLMPLAFESFNLDEFDIVISVTSAEAKGILTKPNQLHLCYMLTPTRYLYSHAKQYQQSQWQFHIPGVSLISQKLIRYLRWWDQAAAYRPDYIIPISHLVAERIEKYYHRSSEKVIYPPIDPDEVLPQQQELTYIPYYLPSEYLLIISRLVSYKKLDIAIQAAQQLQRNLVVVGEGPAESELRSIATDSTYFLGKVSDTQLQAILAKATAVLMPGLEDFGITALEAAFAGKPVIIHQKSGVSELFSQGAVKLQTVTVSEMKKAIKQLDSLDVDFPLLQKNITKYAITDFTKRFQKTVFKLWETYQTEM